MLAVQIDYWKQQEQVRHDFETEINERNKIQEQIRANQAAEQQKRNELVELERHNRAIEEYNQQQADIARYQAESQRITAEANELNARSNALQAQASQIQAQASILQAQAAQSQASTAAYNAQTNRLNYAETKSYHGKQVNESKRHNVEMEDLEMRSIQTSRENANRQAQARENSSAVGLLGTALSGVAHLFGLAIGN